jgi:MFS family permease
VIVAVLLLKGVHQQQSEVKKGFRAALADIRDGVRFIRHQPLILSTMILDFIATFFSSANTLLPYFSQNYLHVEAVAYGWLAAAQSVGAVTVGLVASQYNRIRRQGPLLLAAVVVFGLATILFGAARAYALAFIALMLIGAADSVSTIIRNTIRQLITPTPAWRMTSINQIFMASAAR